MTKDTFRLLSNMVITFFDGSTQRLDENDLKNMTTISEIKLMGKCLSIVLIKDIIFKGIENVEFRFDMRLAFTMYFHHKHPFYETISDNTIEVTKGSGTRTHSIDFQVR